MVRSTQRRFGKLVAALLLLPGLGGCAIPLSPQLVTGATGATEIMSSAVISPATTAAGSSTDAQDTGGTAPADASKSSSSTGDDDTLIEDPKYFSACTFQRRSQDGLPEGEKKPVSEAKSDDYPVMERLGMARTAQGYIFVFIQYQPPITNSQETTFTIYPNQERNEFMQIQVARDTVTSTSYGRGNPHDTSNREPDEYMAYFAKERINDARYSSNNVILAHLAKKYARSYRMETVLTMETDKTVSECVYNPDDPRNKAS